MKITLKVLTSGKSEGQTIPITLPQFLIGRDPQCHLRPASALISKRHCALLIRGARAFVRDFDSTNGTFVNDEAVKGEREIRDKDRLKIGPLSFEVSITAGAPPKAAAPAKPAAQPSEDDSAAAMLLSLGDDEAGPEGSGPVDEEGIPIGSTVMEAMTPDGAEAAPSAAASAKTTKQPAAADTSQAAKRILDRYIRRPRT